MRLELYTKPRCSLCERAQALLAEAQRRHAFTVEEHDITRSPVLYERFRYDVPVIVREGEVVLRLRFSEDELERLFA